MATLDELTTLLPPSGVPVPMDWDDVQHRLGRPLPDDYKGFIDRYGAGTIDDYLHIYAPDTSDIHIDLLANARRDADTKAWAVDVLRTDHPNFCPYPLYPEPGGLAIAHDDSGEVLWWQTRDVDPNRWPIVAGGHHGEWEEHPGTLVDYLVAVLSGTHVCVIHPDDFPSTTPVTYDTA